MVWVPTDWRLGMEVRRGRGRAEDGVATLSVGGRVYNRPGRTDDVSLEQRKGRTETGGVVSAHTTTLLSESPQNEK